MNTKAWLIIVVFILSVIIVLYGAYVGVYNKKTEDYEPASANDVDEVVPVPVIDYLDWKVFRDTGYGFNFAYPKDYLVEESVGGESGSSPNVLSVSRPDRQIVVVFKVVNATDEAMRTFSSDGRVTRETKSESGLVRVSRTLIIGERLLNIHGSYLEEDVVQGASVKGIINSVDVTEE